MIIISFIFAFLLAIIDSATSDIGWRGTLITFTAIATILFLILFFKYDMGKKKNYYVVTLDDTVSWNYIYENYDVIKVQDSLVTLREK